MDNTEDIKEVIKEGEKEKEGGEKKNSKKPLNAKQERFVIEYVKSGNAKLSAINAGYKADYAKERGYSLLQDSRIRTLVDTEKAKLHKGLLKDRSVFLCEVEDLKRLCLEKGRVGELIKLLTLEASVLGIDKRDVSTQTTNIFNSIDTAKSFLQGFKDTNTDKAYEGSTTAEIVEPDVTSCNTEHTTQEGGENKDTLCTEISTSSTGETTTINLENRG